MSELGAQRPVTAYVAPMRAGRLLDGPLAAAHFVSLIEFERGVSGEGGALGADVWRTAPELVRGWRNGAALLGESARRLAK